MKQTYLTVLEEFLTSGGCLEPGYLQCTLEHIGIVGSDGKIVERGLLERMLRLAEAPVDEQSAALQLPKKNPLRLFYERSLAGQSEESWQILDLVRRHILPRKNPDLFQSSHAPLPARTNNFR